MIEIKAFGKKLLFFCKVVRTRGPEAIKVIKAADDLEMKRKKKFVRTDTSLLFVPIGQKVTCLEFCKKQN